MRKCRRLVFLWMMVLAAALPAAGLAAWRQIPQALRFTQEQAVEQRSNNRMLVTVHPKTANREVNEAIGGLVDAMYEKALPNLPKKGRSKAEKAKLDVGPYISRVGDRWMSFLTVARVSDGKRQTYVDFDARVYEMDTGAQIRLGDVIDGEKDGWAFLSGEVRAQLSAFFPGKQASPETLDALCAEESLRERGFTLTPGHLSLPFRVDELYPDGPVSLMHVDIVYSALRPYMTERALRETDCTGYQFVALTYDDGPATGATDNLINQLRLYGAGATFFTVGHRCRSWPGLLNREYDAGFNVQSHGWRHEYEATAEEIASWTASMAKYMEETVGLAPVMFRAPGGNEDVYIRGFVHMPMIRWAVISGDADKTKLAQQRPRVIYRVSSAEPGSVVLLHDIHDHGYDFAAHYLPALENRNIMPVTVMDLCEIAGVTLEPDKVYFMEPVKLPAWVVPVEPVEVTDAAETAPEAESAEGTDAESPDSGE